MAIRVTVTTESETALVLIYPRDGDPVAGESFTEVAIIGPDCEKQFTVGAGYDLLVAEKPAPVGESAAEPVREAA